MINAIHAAKKKFALRSLAMFSEVLFSYPDLPGIGPVSGPVDYITASLPLHIPLSRRGGRSSHSKPLFLVVETKKEQTIGDASSSAQLMAQLMTAHYKDMYDLHTFKKELTYIRDNPVHSGVLTDGVNWEFYTFHTSSQPSTSDDDVPSSINLYLTGRIAGVDKNSKKDIIGM